MELAQIRYFLAVAESLNFTRAAESSAVSQPALSKAISKLEDSLGAKLFDRSSQQVRLTEFGRTMRVHFEHLEENRRRAIDAAKVATVTPTEFLHVGVMCTIGPRRFSQFLDEFHNSRPDIKIALHDITATVIPELLLGGGLDCAIYAGTESYDRRFQAIDLFEENMVVAFCDGHRFNEMNTVTLYEIATETYLDRLHCEFRDDFLIATKASGLELDVSFCSEREDWILELIQKGLGVAVMPQSSAVLNDLAHKDISDLDELRKVELVMSESATTYPALTAFRDAARAFDWES